MERRQLCELLHVLRLLLLLLELDGGCGSVGALLTVGKAVARCGCGALCIDDAPTAAWSIGRDERRIAVRRERSKAAVVRPSSVAVLWRSRRGLLLGLLLDAAATVSSVLLRLLLLLLGECEVLELLLLSEVLRQLLLALRILRLLLLQWAA